jgi:prepilin-type processing-associated H-X9-DG protein
LEELYGALERFALEHGGAFPYDLSALVPAYVDDPRFTTGERGVREIEYEGGLYMPSADDDLELAGDLDITPDEAVGLYAEGAALRVEPFLTELVSESWLIAPSGRVVLYLDGTTAWENYPESVPPLPQEVIELRANDHTLSCQGNLRLLGTALENWLRDWEEMYPQDLESLYPRWLTDLQLLACPEEELHAICYELVYSAQARPAEEEFPSPEAAVEYYATMPVVVEVGNPHLGGHNVLYMDGHVEWQP